MSDFDEVLERLLTDPVFQARLAADPGSALAGYQLSADERDLLNAQLVLGAGAEHAVETRTNKSGVVGLLGPVAAALGVAGAAGAAGAPSTTNTFGDAAGRVDTFGKAADVTEQSFGFKTETEAPIANVGAAPVEATGYQTYVDADGDGTWDQYRAYERADGGVDIHVDADHDGRTDFVGHDVDRDSLVDYADFDNDNDGIVETRMYDDTGDGWMDRSERIVEPTRDASR